MRGSILLSYCASICERAARVACLKATKFQEILGVLQPNWRAAISQVSLTGFISIVNPANVPAILSQDLP